MKIELNKLLWYGLGIFVLALFFKEIPTTNMDLVKEVIAATIGAVSGAAVTTVAIKNEEK